MASSNSPKPKVNFAGVSETMLVTLSARADDSRRPDSILKDRWAAEALDAMDYKRVSTVADRGVFSMVLLRARLIDTWATEFLTAHPGATVLHLACGLDSRAHRLGVGPTVRWIDLDLPDVVELRRKVTSEPSGDYRLVASSVTDYAWLEEIPADRPTLVIMEGLLMYLQPADAELLFKRIVERFPSGQLLCDTVGSAFIALQIFNRSISRTGARMYYGIDDVKDLETTVPGLHNRDALKMAQVPGVELLPWYLRWTIWFYSWLPGLKLLSTYSRFDFSSG